MTGPYYWCLKHGRVEGEAGCSNDQRMGPYASEEEASHALASAKEHNDAWDAEDARFRGDAPA